MENQKQVDSLQSKEENKDEKKVLPNKRKIIIETDGNTATLITAEVAGNLELVAILQGIINAIQRNQ
jgi:hypothetical protein